ncbi:MAG TPA: hypothetical protein VGB07_15450 [Blastocatellia bacterium]|jgi:hypothetical protein
MTFTIHKLTKIQLLALCVAVAGVLTTLAINSRQLLTIKVNRATPIAEPPAIQTGKRATPLGKGYIERQGIWPQLHSALDAYGDRLEKPGKERLIATGTLSNASTTNNEKLPVHLVFEFPDKLRIEKQKGNNIETTIFDGKAKTKIGDTIKPQEEEELEALVFDSIDHFMAAHATGKPLRFLGDRFRLDDGTAVNYTGSYYDIYQIAEQQFDANNNRKETVQQKLYFFNSDTHKLERITYQAADKKETVKVAVELAGWQKLDGQVVPTSLTHFENGKPTIILTIGTVALMPRANDGIFSTTQK